MKKRIVMQMIEYGRNWNEYGPIAEQTFRPHSPRTAAGFVRFVKAALSCKTDYGNYFECEITLPNGAVGILNWREFMDFEGSETFENLIKAAEKHGLIEYNLE